MKPLTLSDLRTRQAWPLNQKIDHTCYAMETFVAYCKEHDRTPYVSFSGGLNSTVLLDLARRFVDPNMKGVFCSTGNEYPEIVRFVRHTDNIEIIHPAMPPREVMARYGFPLVFGRPTATNYGHIGSTATEYAGPAYSQKNGAT